MLNTKNVAAVMVTASLPAFAAPGTRIDVSVSALGDATNLQGGTLLVTPLLGADGEVYAMAQGALAIGGFIRPGGAPPRSRAACPPPGASPMAPSVEREIDFQLAGQPRRPAPRCAIPT